MLKVETIQADQPALQSRKWPPVAAFDELDGDLREFLAADAAGKRALLTAKRGNHELHGGYIHKCLNTIYAYIYGYEDSPCYLKSEPDLEISLLAAKVILEEELLRSWLPLRPLPAIKDQREAVEYLRDFTVSNVGVPHELWNFIRDEIKKSSMLEFLRLVTCRNEVVDDECALLLCGLQGNMKKVMASNLWDECGNGRLTQFHTYWLRRLIERTEDWEALPRYRRERKKPWFSGVLSNTFNVLLTRPCYKFRAYGCFLTTESWVYPHFVRILGGLRRVGLDHDDIAMYFSAHTKIDIHHTKELFDGFLYQSPALTSEEATEVVMGAHIAEAAAICQYRGVLDYFRSLQAE